MRGVSISNSTTSKVAKCHVIENVSFKTTLCITSITLKLRRFNAFDEVVFHCGHSLDQNLKI